MNACLHRLFHQQRGLCWYCDRTTYLPTSGETKEHARQRMGIVTGECGSAKVFRRRYATIEHLKRQCDGGTKLDGIVMACQGCNSTRQDRTPEEHKTMIRAALMAAQ